MQEQENVIPEKTKEVPMKSNSESVVDYVRKNMPRLPDESDFRFNQRVFKTITVYKKMNAFENGIKNQFISNNKQKRNKNV